MSLKSKIQEDMKSAMKAGDALRTQTVRMALSELKRYEADQGAEPDEATSLGILEKMIKQRRDSEAQFRSGNRPELADKEAAEIGILSVYLPQPLSESEVAALIEQGKAETGAAGPKDMGKLMAWLKPKVAGRTDMGRLSGLVKAKLA
ncbi:MAG TPA: GatB/YqeY domain-containing protein [Candidatus Binatia bacterium]|nr:GatB/YqeY domain-containing protein [Candidatus Binatia bacterium]